MPLLLILMACKGDPPEKEPPPIGGADTFGPCPGHDPELGPLTLANGGMITFEGQDWPAILISTDATDEDGNLEMLTLDLWWDDGADGKVDSSGTPKVTKTYSPEDGDPCTVTAANVALNLQVGQGLAYNTNYDFAAQITDSEGEISNVVIATGSTPKANGQDGDGTGP